MIKKNIQNMLTLLYWFSQKSNVSSWKAIRKDRPMLSNPVYPSLGLGPTLLHEVFTGQLLEKVKYTSNDCEPEYDCSKTNYISITEINILFLFPTFYQLVWVTLFDKMQRRHQEFLRGGRLKGRELDFEGRRS